MTWGEHNPVGGDGAIGALLQSMRPWHAAPLVEEDEYRAEMHRLVQSLYTVALEAAALNEYALVQFRRDEPPSLAETTKIIARFHLSCQFVAQALAAAKLDNGSWTAAPDLTDALTCDIPEEAEFQVPWQISEDEWQRARESLQRDHELGDANPGHGVYNHCLYGPATFTYGERTLFTRTQLHGLYYFDSDEEWQEYWSIVGVDAPPRPDFDEFAALPILDAETHYYMMSLWQMIHDVLEKTTLAHRLGVGSHADTGFYFPGTFHFQWTAHLVIIRNTAALENEMVVRIGDFVVGARAFLAEFATAVRTNIPGVLDSDRFRVMREYRT